MVTLWLKKAVLAGLVRHWVVQRVLSVLHKENKRLQGLDDALQLWAKAYVYMLLTLL